LACWNSENYQADPKLLEQHLAITGGKVRTRFPPEPNVRNQPAHGWMDGTCVHVLTSDTRAVCRVTCIWVIANR